MDRKKKNHRRRVSVCLSACALSLLSSPLDLLHQSQQPHIAINLVNQYQDQLTDNQYSEVASSSSLSSTTTSTFHHLNTGCIPRRMFAPAQLLMESNVTISSSRKLWTADLHRRVCESEFVWT